MDNTTPESILRVVRVGFPNSIKDKLFTVFPMEKPIKPDYVDHYETVQEIYVYDPRQIISENPDGPGDRVIVSRIQKQVPIYKVSVDPSFHIVYTRTIEVLKEYTFEEWDAGLVWEETK